MKKVDFLIVGGSGAGTTAAEVIRTLTPDASISIVTDEDHEQYSRVLLPHYIRGKVAREQVFLKKPDWYHEKKIELVRRVKAVSIDPKSKRVRVTSGEEIEYGKLLISIGGYVVPLKIPGANDANICYMRTIEDADRIIAEAKKAKKAVIIGGGFIGLEFTSCFKVNGVDELTLLVKEPYFWSGKLDEDSAGAIGDVLAKNGVKIVTNIATDKFENGSVFSSNGKEFSADVFGVGIGIRPDLKSLEASGIEINRAIVTNEYLETNLPDVYAAGDCAEFKDVIFGRQHIMGNWANATSQGSAVGKTMSGQKTVFETASSYSINFFDGSCSFIGVTDDKFADQVIKRGSRADGKVTRIFIKKFSDRGSTPQGVEPLGEQVRIVGATIINNPADVAPLTMAIKNKSDVGAYVSDLGKADSDLKSLLG